MTIGSPAIYLTILIGGELRYQITSGAGRKRASVVVVAADRSFVGEDFLDRDFEEPGGFERQR